MKFTKNQAQNIIFLILVALLIFTPVGTGVKVYLNRWLSFAPKTVSENERVKVEEYQWRLESVDGKAYDFLNAENKVVLVNFWATWCPPCIAEMPSLQKLYNDYKDEVVFLFVTQDTNEAVKKFMAGHKYSFPVYSASSNRPEQFESKSIPATYVLNKNGEIVIDKKGAADWDSESVRQTLDTLLAE